MGDNVNERIRYYRELKKVSQKKVCEAIGMKQNAYSQMERYGKRIPLDRIKAIAKCLGIDHKYLLEEETQYDLTPVTPRPLEVNDPIKDNPFIVPAEPKISLGVTNGEIVLSNEEGQVLTLFRSLNFYQKQEFLKYLNNLKEKK